MKPSVGKDVQQLIWARTLRARKKTEHIKKSREIDVSFKEFKQLTILDFI